VSETESGEAATAGEEGRRAQASTSGSSSDAQQTSTTAKEVAAASLALNTEPLAETPKKSAVREQSTEIRVANQPNRRLEWARLSRRLSVPIFIVLLAGATVVVFRGSDRSPRDPYPPGSGPRSGGRRCR
jgi:hypothetical protein